MGEMEACRGAGNRSVAFREDGLITLPVEGFIFTLDVGGQRDAADLLKMIGDLASRRRIDLPFSILHLFHDPVKILSEAERGSPASSFSNL